MSVDANSLFPESISHNRSVGESDSDYLFDDDRSMTTGSAFVGLYSSLNPKT
jgi:hypothetical protein